MKHTAFLRASALATCVAIGGAIVTPPAVALADNSTAAAIAIGAIVGTLIYDSSRSQYYYVNNYHRRVYVNTDTARAWYQRQDPHWWAAHQNDFYHNPGRFDQNYRHDHHGHHPRP